MYRFHYNFSLYVSVNWFQLIHMQVLDALFTWWGFHTTGRAHISTGWETIRCSVYGLMISHDRQRPFLNRLINYWMHCLPVEDFTRSIEDISQPVEKLLDAVSISWGIHTTDRDHFSTGWGQFSTGWVVQCNHVISSSGYRLRNNYNR